VLFENEETLLNVVENLKKNDIVPRRYFWPSLNKLPYIKSNECRVSETVSSMVLCLPFFNGIEDDDISTIVHVINRML
jgi:dTDP-4-amino-4,6-dideoxygalactose transaminase